MMTQPEIEELAKKHAFNILTCSGPVDIDWVLEMWSHDINPKCVPIWSRFEDYSGRDLLDQFKEFEARFLSFAQEISG